MTKEKQLELGFLVLIAGLQIAQFVVDDRIQEDGKELFTNKYAELCKAFKYEVELGEATQ